MHLKNKTLVLTFKKVSVLLSTLFAITAPIKLALSGKTNFEIKEPFERVQIDGEFVKISIKSIKNIPLPQDLTIEYTHDGDDCCNISAKVVDNTLLIESKKKPSWTFLPSIFNSFNTTSCPVAFNLSLQEHIPVDLKIANGEVNVEGMKSNFYINMAKGSVKSHCALSKFAAKGADLKLDLANIVGDMDIISAKLKLDLANHKGNMNAHGADLTLNLTNIMGNMDINGNKLELSLSDSTGNIKVKSLNAYCFVEIKNNPSYLQKIYLDYLNGKVDICLPDKSEVASIFSGLTKARQRNAFGYSLTPNFMIETKTHTGVLNIGSKTVPLHQSNY